MLIARALLFNAVLFGWTALLGTLTLPALLGPPRWSHAISRVWIAVLFGALKLIVGLDHEVRGRENLPEGAFVIASKHQSAWDTLVWSTLFDQVAIVLKRELFMVPLFGWFLKRAGMIGIDRAQGASAMKRMLREARAAADAGRPLLIFPEGTRTPPGARRPYHPGIAALYLHLGLPVVPVALNSGLFWGRRSFLKHPGRIVLEFLPPIPPGLGRAAFMRELETRIETATDRLCG